MKEMKIEPVRKGLILDSVRLLVYLLATSYIFFVLATSRPHAGAWYDIFLLMLLPGICFRSFLVFYTLVYKKQITHKWIPRIITVIAGLFFAGQLISLETDLAADRFKRAYQPLVNSLAAEQVGRCQQSGDKLQIPETIRPKTKKPEMMGRTQWQTYATIYFAESHFVLSIPGSSIDIDGSRLYYESRGKHWKLFHNDKKEEVEKFSKLTEDAIVCIVPES